MRSFSLLPAEDPAAPGRSVQELTDELQKKCTACRLGMLAANEHGSGFFFRGSLNAEVAAVTDYPLPVDLLAYSFLGHPAGDEFQKWILRTGLHPKNLFTTYLVQCKTPEAAGNSGQKTCRPPLPEEIQACFFSRTLPVLKALPNLEVVLALGHQAAKTLLGSKEASKHLQGNWFGTDLLPGAAIFCLPHPREIASRDSAMQRGRLYEFLEFFSNEYVAGKKILQVLDTATARRQEEKQRYAL